MFVLNKRELAPAGLDEEMLSMSVRDNADVEEPLRALLALLA